MAGLLPSTLGKVKLSRSPLLSTTMLFQDQTRYRRRLKRNVHKPFSCTSFSFIWITAFLMSYLIATVGAQDQDGLLYRLREEQDADTYVGNIARDSQIYTQFSPEEFENLEYRIPASVKKFTIDKKASTLRTTQVIDRETECERGSLQPGEPCLTTFDSSVFRINAEGNFELLLIIKVTINILDINDNAPEFPSNKTTLDIPESVEVGEVLHTSAAFDLDAGPNNTVQVYLLEGGGDMFELQVMSNPGASNQAGPSTGSSTSDLGIVLKKRLDRETESSYQLRILAIDGGIKPRTGTVQIAINVLDANDNRPKFERSSFTTELPEDTPRGSTVLTLLASDLDAEQNGKIFFSLSLPIPTKISEYFGINGTSGEIYLVKPLDYEKDRSFTFSVTVTDGGRPAKSSETSVSISVTDVNDNAPQIQVTLPQATIRENMKVGGYIAHLSPSDRDSSANSAIFCSVVNNEHFALQKFSDTGSVFKVILSKRLDYERNRTEVVNVTCHDGGNPPLSNSTAFTLQVQDVNDNAPVFERPEYRAHIEEGNHVGQFVVQVLARDPDDGDNGNVTYTLVENPGGRFAVNSLSGVVKARAELDREDELTYQLVIQALDSGSPALSSTVKVTVAVDDINDSPPSFPVPVIEMRIMENRPKNSVVGTVRAEDPDTGPRTDNHLRYSIKGDFQFSNLFALDRVSGVLYTRVPLDREARDSYTIGVEVVDESQPNFKAEAQVSVLVSDDNDHAPSFTFPGAVGPDNSTIVLSFARPAGSIIMTLAWEDADSGDNASVTFSILTGDDAKLFFLHAVTGELMVARRMDSRDVGVYTLVVLARDGGVSFQETRRDLHVEITPANGTVGFLDDGESSSANIAIVVALVCITAVLALAVLVTICIIRRIDRERKHHSSAKVEEENIYKQLQQRPKSPASNVSNGGLHTVTITDSAPGYKQAATSPGIPASPTVGGRDNEKNLETELDKLRRKVKEDLSFVVEDDSNPLDGSHSLNASSFSTFKNNSSSSAGILSSGKKSHSTAQSHSSVLQNTLSPTEGHVKRVHYMDKGLDIDRLTAKSPPPRSQPGAPTSHGYQSGGFARSGPWSSSGRAQHGPEDSASHSSGSTSDSGRGASSEESEGQGQNGHAHHPKQHAVVVTLGDGGDGPDSPKTPTNTYPTPAHLMTFMSPRRSPASSSGTSVLPRSSLSASLTSDTAKKRLWAESNSNSNSNATPSSISSSNVTTTGGNDTTPTNLSAKMSDNSPLYPVGFAERSPAAGASVVAAAGSLYRPNISLSDDSVTANATVRGGPNTNRLNAPVGNDGSSSRARANTRTPLGRNYGQRSGSTPNLLHTVPSSKLSPTEPGTTSAQTPATFTSTRRQHRSESYPDPTDSSPHRLLAANLSRIPTDPEVSTRHGTFLEGPSTSLVVDPSSGSAKPSRSYANASRTSNANESNSSHDNVFTPGIHGGPGHYRNQNNRPDYYNSNHNRNSFHGDARNNSNSRTSPFNPSNSNNNVPHLRLGGSLRAEQGYFGQRPPSTSGRHVPNLSTIDQSSTASSQGEPYSMSDMKAVLDAASTVDKPRDDDNTTTTSGSYTINADDLCQEIDHLFFKDVVV